MLATSGWLAEAKSQLPVSGWRGTWYIIAFLMYHRRLAILPIGLIESSDLRYMRPQMVMYLLVGKISEAGSTSGQAVDSARKYVC